MATDRAGGSEVNESLGEFCSRRKKIMVSDGTRDVTLHGEKYVNWYAANVAPLREGK